MTTPAEALPYPPDDPATVEGVATRCARAATVAGQAGDDLMHDDTLLLGSWEGPAARGCRLELRGAARLVRSVVEPLQHAARLLRAHAHEVAEARAAVDGLRREYDALVSRQARELTVVLHDGSVAGRLGQLQVEETRRAQQAELAALHRRHREVLDRLADRAAQAGRQVCAAAAAVGPGTRNTGRPVGDREGELAAVLPLLAASRLAAGVGGRPPAPGTPAGQVRQWWAALTSDEQTRAVLHWAEELGTLDGLPGAVRSAANERRLADDVTALRGRAALTDDDRRWLGTCLVVREQLARVRAGEDPLSLDPITAQLLVFEPTAFGHEGRAAIAVGDVDTADNVAFLVPGLGSDVQQTMSGLTGDALRVTTEARRLSPAATTATVAWVGYDAPGLSKVGFEGAAEAGADLLVTDLLAVQAARDVLPHLTVVGHSYGSTTTGAALRDRATGADDVVLVGSPGAEVERATDLHVSPGHVFVGASSRDPVSYLDRFGKDPAHASFGATRFEAEDPTRDSWRLDLDDHAKYFNAGTESLANIAHVVTADYAGVVRAPYRDEVLLLPDGINSDPETDREPTTVP